MLAERKPKYEVVKGAMSALGLYAKLYEFSAEKTSVVFDDCDSVLMDELSLNILKGALDSSKKRTLLGILTADCSAQKAFQIALSSKVRLSLLPTSSLSTFVARSFAITWMHWKAVATTLICRWTPAVRRYLRIRQIVGDGMLDEYEFEPCVVDEIVSFIDANKTRLRELSLRMVLKIADLRKSFPTSWTAMAKTTCMKRGA
jgi:hypothetical protein